MGFLDDLKAAMAAKTEQRRILAALCQATRREYYAYHLKGDVLGVTWRRTDATDDEFEADSLADLEFWRKWKNAQSRDGREGELVERVLMVHEMFFSPVEFSPTAIFETMAEGLDTPEDLRTGAECTSYPFWMEYDPDDRHSRPKGLWFSRESAEKNTWWKIYCFSGQNSGWAELSDRFRLWFQVERGHIRERLEERRQKATEGSVEP